MKTFTPMAVCMLLAGSIPGTALAKDLYVSAKGSDQNDGLTASTPKKTLTALDAIIEKNDIIYVSGLLDMNDEIADDFNPAVGMGAGDLNDCGGKFVSHDAGKKLGFNIASRGSKNWQGITFIGEDPATDGFSGGGKWGHFIIRGKNEGGTTFKNLSFIDGISNLDGGTIFIKDEAIVTFENCSFSNNHPDFATTYKLEGNAWKPNGSASERGGCVRTESNCVVNINNCTFESNINRHGGAVMICGSANGINNTGGVTITNSTFLNNTAWCFDDPEQYLDNTQGAAIEVWSLNADCYLKVDHCVFDGNKVWNNGGAVYIYDNIKYGHYADVTISNSAFYYNEAERGGALQISNYADGPMERKDYLTKTKNVNLLNCTFVNNSARTDGGAILYWGAMTDATQADYPQDEFRMVNCTLIGNSTNGNAGHGAGYKEMNRSGDNEAFGKVGNANRYFYNCIMENNYALESNETSDFCTGELFGVSMDNNYIGRIVVTGGAPVEEFLGIVNNGEGVKASVIGYSGEQLGDNTFYVANDAVATGLYDMSGFMIPGVAIPGADSPLKSAGDVKWLTLAQREVAIPNTTDRVVYRSGYDISKADALGFARPESTCAVGASEFDVETITPYLDGTKDLPYLSEGEQSAIDAIASDIKSVSLTRNGDIIAADGALITVFDLSGVKVAAGNDSVNISSLNSGVYVVKAQGAEGSAVAKIIK